MDLSQLALQTIKKLFQIHLQNFDCKLKNVQMNRET